MNICETRQQLNYISLAFHIVFPCKIAVLDRSNIGHAQPNKEPTMRLDILHGLLFPSMEGFKLSICSCQIFVALRWVLLLPSLNMVPFLFYHTSWVSPLWKVCPLWRSWGLFGS